MFNFLLGLLTVFFLKELIVLNQEIIIYVTFISITLLCIHNFKFLENSFDNLRTYEKTNLKIPH